jgi:transcriptional regulator with XRE-family HTH domain
MPGDLSLTFGKQLRRIRQAQGLSQDQLAERTGLHATAIGRIERGAREPRVTTVLRLARGLGVRAGTLIDPLV